MKKVLILAGSPRKDGNSDLLCGEFLRGARDAGHDAEKIFISDMNINYCTACAACYARREPCPHGDDMTEITDKMAAADVIVLSTPVYFYAMSGQLKTLIDRTIGRFFDLRGKEFYYIITAHVEKDGMTRVVESLRGYLDCIPEAREMGIIYGGGVFGAGEIRDKPAMQEAYDAGRAL